LIISKEGKNAGIETVAIPEKEYSSQRRILQKEKMKNSVVYGSFVIKNTTDDGENGLQI